jgi:hypothetical protein
METLRKPRWRRLALALLAIVGAGGCWLRVYTLVTGTSEEVPFLAVTAFGCAAVAVIISVLEGI